MVRAMMSMDRIYYQIRGKEKLKKFLELGEKNPSFKKLFEEIKKEGISIFASKFFLSFLCVNQTDGLFLQIKSKGKIFCVIFLSYEIIDLAISGNFKKQITSLFILSHEVGHLKNKKFEQEIDLQRKSSCSQNDCLYKEILASEVGLELIQKEIGDSIPYRGIKEKEQFINFIKKSVWFGSFTLQCIDCLPFILLDFLRCPFISEIKEKLPEIKT